LDCVNALLCPFLVLIRFRDSILIPTEVTIVSDWLFKGFVVQFFTDMKCIFLFQGPL